MNALGEYMEREGRTADEVAVDLSALTGKKIGAQGVRMWAARSKTPKAWAEALGLPADPIPAEEADYLEGTIPEDRGEFSSRDEGAPPTPPPGSKLRPVPGGGSIHVAAKKRIELAYTAIGAGATLVTQNHGYEAVADQYAPNLADAWIAAAETSPTVAKIVRFMESGGPVGELVVGHIILVLGFAYISGRGPDLEVIYGKFAGYRAAAIANAVEREAAAHLNGSGQASADSPLGEPAV